MKKTIFTLFILGFLSASTANAQEMFNTFGLGISASTNGFGGSIYWLPTTKWKVAINGEYMPTINIKQTIHQADVSVDLAAKYRTGGVSLSGGYQFLSWMYLTAGAGLNFFNPSAKGMANSIQYGDIVLKPETVGELSLDIKAGTKLAPFAAIGFGKQAASKKRVAASLEIGTIYMGAPKLSVNATGMLSPTMEATHVKSLEDQLSLFRFYPLIKVSLTINLFKL